MDKRYNNVTSVKKESPEKHVKQGNPHLHAVDLEKKTTKKTCGRYSQSRVGFFFASREEISKNG